MVMMKRDVPAALTGATLNERTRIGIARNPPPIPKRPVNAPMTSEINMRAIGETFRSVTFDGVGISIEMPALTKTKAKPVSTISSGMRGRKYAPERFVIKPIAQITNASLTSTSLSFSFGITPESAPTKTTNRDAVVAVTGVSPNTYMKSFVYVVS